LNPGGVVPINPTAADTGIFYTRINGITLPQGQTIPMSATVGTNDPDFTGSTPAGANYIQSTPLILEPPGMNTAYSGYTTITMNNVFSKVLFSVFGQTTVSDSAAARLPALLAVGYLPPSDASQVHFDPNAHLKTLSQIIEDKGNATNLHYPVSERIPALDLGTLYDDLPNYSIFYILGHSEGTPIRPPLMAFWFGARFPMIKTIMFHYLAFLSIQHLRLR
jgi:hypothetical protein